MEAGYRQGQGGSELPDFSIRSLIYLYAVLEIFFKFEVMVICCSEQRIGFAYGSYFWIEFPKNKSCRLSFPCSVSILPLFCCGIPRYACTIFN